jgi:Domain of unknown function (DUF6265)
MRLTLWLMIASIVTLTSTAYPQDQGGRKIDDLKWLSGCWQVDQPGRDVIEQWTQPGGGMMLGVSRTVKDGKTTEYEFIKIADENGILVYTAKPSSQAEASFKLTANSSGEDYVFENLAHDFPQRIIYSRKSNNALVARIEGTLNGKTRSIEFPMKRVACGGAAKSQ